MPVLTLHKTLPKSNTFQSNLAAEAFMDACDCFQEEPQACEKRKGGAGPNQARVVPQSWAGQTRKAGNSLWAQMTRLDITHY